MIFRYGRFHGYPTPQELAKLYLENVPPEELASYSAKKKRRFGIAFILLVLTITMALVFQGYPWNNPSFPFYYIIH